MVHLASHHFFRFGSTWVPRASAQSPPKKMEILWEMRGEGRERGERGGREEGRGVREGRGMREEGRD